MADRTIVYPFEVPFDVDILRSQLNSYKGLAAYIDCIIGSVTSLNGFNCTESTPPALTVEVDPGQIYQLAATDPTAYGSIPADTTEIMKQGISAVAVTIPTPAPGTVGESVKYLIQIEYSQVDGLSESRAFKPPPSQIVDSARQDLAVVAVKAGVPALTGTEVAPTPDAGFTGAWIITVANGQPTVLNSDIVRDPTAPFILEKLQDKSSDARFTGEVMLSYRAVNNPPPGWIIRSGSIGDSGSAATTRANADTLKLFEVMWDNVPDVWAPVSGGRGAGAIADFDAGKTLTLPTMDGRAIGVAGFSGGLTARALGEPVGAEEITLVEAEMPNHFHSSPNAEQFITDLTTGSPATTAKANGAEEFKFVGTTTSAGGGGPHNNMQPTVFINAFIKL